MITADERLANALAARLPVKWLGAFAMGENDGDLQKTEISGSKTTSGLVAIFITLRGVPSSSLGCFRNFPQSRRGLALPPGQPTLAGLAYKAKPHRGTSSSVHSAFSIIGARSELLGTLAAIALRDRGRGFLLDVLQMVKQSHWQPSRAHRTSLRRIASAHRPDRGRNAAVLSVPGISCRRSIFSGRSFRAKLAESNGGFFPMPLPRHADFTTRRSCSPRPSAFMHCSEFSRASANPPNNGYG